MSFSDQLGFIPQSADELMRDFYLAWAQLVLAQTGQTVTEQEWVATDIYIFADRIAIPSMLRAQKTTAISQNNIFQWFSDEQRQINEGRGGSMLGFANAVASICEGLYILNSENSSGTLSAWQIQIFFDNLDLLATTELEEAFLTLAPCVETKARAGDLSITVTIPELKLSNSSFTYRFNNLVPADYTVIDVRLGYMEGQRPETYSALDFETALRERWDAVISIGYNLSPQELISTFDFKGIVGFVLEHKLSTEPDTAYQTGIRTCQPYQKYSLGIVTSQSVTPASAEVIDG